MHTLVPMIAGPRQTTATSLLLALFARACAYDVVTSDGPMYDHRDDPIYIVVQRWLLAQGVLTPQQCVKDANETLRRDT